jgi:hypothetical protein
MILTGRDKVLVGTLASKVRVISIKMVAEWQFNGSEAAAMKRIKTLAGERLIDVYRVLAASLPHLKEPLVKWRPGEAKPDIGKLAAYLRRERFAGPVRATTVISIRGGRRPRPSETSHDLALAAIWLELRDKKGWKLEGGKSRPGERVPDAVQVRRAETVAHEIAGSSYTAAKLTGLFDYVAARGWSIWLW